MIEATEQLTAEEEAELGRRVRAWKDHGIDPEGGLAARNELVERNVRLVGWALGGIHVVREREREEYAPAGYSGLIRAADKFDPSAGRFSTYAVAWIRQFIRRAIQCERVIHVPAHVWDKSKKYAHLVPGGEPPKAYTCVDPWILDATADDRREADAEELVALLLGEVSLQPKDRDILMRYFGLEGAPETLQAIGESYGHSRDAIRQRREKTLAILAAAARGRLRESFEAGGYLRAI